MNYTYKIYNKHTLVLLFTLSLFLFACNKMQKRNNTAPKNDSIPDIVINDINLKQSEKGNITMHLTAPVMKSFQGEGAYSVFPEGFKIESFDSLNKKKSELTANYGISYEDKGLMLAKGNVIVNNLEKQLTLKTEELQWERNNKKVYTNLPVSVVSPDKTIYGKSMESDDIFNNWLIKDVSNSAFIVNEDKKQTKE